MTAREELREKIEHRLSGLVPDFDYEREDGVQSLTGDILALIDAEVAPLVEMLRAIEWEGNANAVLILSCPACGGRKHTSDEMGEHSPDCRLRALLERHKP